MKKIKVFTLSVLSISMLFWANYRSAIVGVGAANMLCLISQASMYNIPTADEAADRATTQNSSPSMTQSDGTIGALGGSLASPRGNGKGFQFKNPVVTPGFSYRSYDDGATGGFAGNEMGGDISMDADIYDGLIAGLFYQHLYRGGSNQFATSERLESNGISLYAGKRFFDLMNVGLSYNHAWTDHRLTRGVTRNLDRDSDGFTVLWGASDRMGHWSWNVTPSLTYVHDAYSKQKALDTSRMTVGMGLNYDAAKWLTVGGALNYNVFLQQDSFTGGALDNDYITIGPRLRFIPLENFAINLDFDDQEGFKNYRSYAAHIGFEYAF